MNTFLIPCYSNRNNLTPAKGFVELVDLGNGDLKLTLGTDIDPELQRSRDRNFGYQYVLFNPAVGRATSGGSSIGAQGGVHRRSGDLTRWTAQGVYTATDTLKDAAQPGVWQLEVLITTVLPPITLGKLDRDCTITESIRFQIDPTGVAPPQPAGRRSDPYVNWNRYPAYTAARTPQPAGTPCSFGGGTNGVATFENLDNNRVFNSSSMRHRTGRWYFVNDCWIQAANVLQGVGLEFRSVALIPICTLAGKGDMLGAEALLKARFPTLLRDPRATLVIAVGCVLLSAGYYYWNSDTVRRIVRAVQGPNGSGTHCGAYVYAFGTYAITPRVWAYPVGGQRVAGPDGPEYRLASSPRLTEEQCDTEAQRPPDVAPDAFNAPGRIALGEPDVVWSEANPPYLVGNLPGPPAGPPGGAAGPGPRPRGAPVLESPLSVDADPGQPATYRYTVTATEEAAAGATLTVQVPEDGEYVSAGGPGCTYSQGTYQVECPLGDVPAGQSRTVDVTLRYPPGSYTVFADASTTSGLGDSTSSLTFVDTPGIHVRMESPDRASYTSDVTHTMRAESTSEPLSGVALHFELAEEAEFVRADDGCTHSGDEVVCRLGSLGPHESRERQVVVRYPEGANWALNFAYATAANGPTDDTSEWATAILVESPTPSLPIVTTGPRAAEVDDDVEYTIEVTSRVTWATDVRIFGGWSTEYGSSSSCDSSGNSQARICDVGDLDEDESASRSVTVSYSEAGTYLFCGFAQSSNGGGPAWDDDDLASWVGNMWMIIGLPHEPTCRATIVSEEPDDDDAGDDDAGDDDAGDDGGDGDAGDDDAGDGDAGDDDGDGDAGDDDAGDDAGDDDAGDDDAGDDDAGDDDAGDDAGDDDAGDDDAEDDDAEDDDAEDDDAEDDDADDDDAGDGDAGDGDAGDDDGCVGTETASPSPDPTETVSPDPTETASPDPTETASLRPMDASSLRMDDPCVETSTALTSSVGGLPIPALLLLLLPLVLLVPLAGGARQGKRNSLFGGLTRIVRRRRPGAPGAAGDRA